MSPPQNPPPSSILIVGSGVFGLSTAYALAQRPSFKKTKITILDRCKFPSPDGASIDASRIIRADYADTAYASLMAEGKPAWLGELGAEGRFTQCGLAIFADDDSDEQAAWFMKNSLANMIERLGLKPGRKDEGGEVEVVADEESVRRVMGTAGGKFGNRGYVNWTSGWAHAEEAMKFVRRKCEETGRVEFRTAEVERLSFRDGKRVEGVELVGGEQITADLTVLATGAWTPKLIDLRGRASATGQALAYIDITPEEQQKLSTNPVFISESSGMFIIPPVDNVLKVARHAYGYANPITIDNPERPGEKITVSLPRTKQDDPDMNIPAEAQAECRQFLRDVVPALGERPWSFTRICWYTDTRTGDFIVDRHPEYEGLFIATGGSGHGFKFLPVIGERIVDVIEGAERDALGKELRQKWAWPRERQAEDHVWTQDWRGGNKGGMILDEEYIR